MKWIKELFGSRLRRFKYNNSKHYRHGYCNYMHRVIFKLDVCKTCSVCNWDWQCNHWKKI